MEGNDNRAWSVFVRSNNSDCERVDRKKSMAHLTPHTGPARPARADSHINWMYLRVTCTTLPCRPIIGRHPSGIAPGRLE